MANCCDVSVMGMQGNSLCSLFSSFLSLCLTVPLSLVYRFEGTLEDYTFLIDGLLQLFFSTCDESWLTWAINLQSKQDEVFWDNSPNGTGGYFLSEKHPHLLAQGLTHPLCWFLIPVSFSQLLLLFFSLTAASQGIHGRQLHQCQFTSSNEQSRPLFAHIQHSVQRALSHFISHCGISLATRSSCLLDHADGCWDVSCALSDSGCHRFWRVLEFFSRARFRTVGSFFSSSSSAGTLTISMCLFCDQVSSICSHRWLTSRQRICCVICFWQDNDEQVCAFWPVLSWHSSSLSFLLLVDQYNHVLSLSRRQLLLANQLVRASIEIAWLLNLTPPFVCQITAVIYLSSFHQPQSLVHDYPLTCSSSQSGLDQLLGSLKLSWKNAVKSAFFPLFN